MLKNPCKATGFHFDSHDCNSNGKVHFTRRLAGLTGGLCGVAGRPFSPYLPSLENNFCNVQVTTDGKRFFRNRH